MPPSPPTLACEVQSQCDAALHLGHLIDSMIHRLQPGRPEILSPTPRRHLLESSASQHWLRTPPLSATSSRAASPASAYGSTTSFQPHRTLQHHTSFSSLLEREQAARGILKPGAARAKSHESLKADAAAENAMGRRWIRWMHKRGIKQWVVPGGIILSMLVKVCMGLGSYSGKCIMTFG